MAAWSFRFSCMVFDLFMGMAVTSGIKRKGGAERVPRCLVPNFAAEQQCCASATVLICGSTREAPASRA